MALVLRGAAGLTASTMPSDPHAPFDQTVLEMIEHSPVGAVPHTPTYQDALGRLYATHQVYASADHKDGHVTARLLARLPLFHAGNLDAVAAGTADVTALEGNAAIFDRYLASLPAALRARAEGHRLKVVGRPVHHRKHHGAIAPGINLSMKALHEAAAKLPRVAIQRPERVIGRDTVSAMQSGVFWGYIDLIDGLVERIKAEYGQSMTVIATGGVASLFEGAAENIDHFDSDITIKGLRILYDRNIGQAAKELK